MTSDEEIIVALDPEPERCQWIFVIHDGFEACLNPIPRGEVFCDKHRHDD